MQSALVQALEHIGQLRDEATFFSWVSAIIRRKILEYARMEKGRGALSLDEIGEAQAWTPDVGLALETADDYARLLDSILELFETYAEHMAILYLRYFQGLEIASLVGLFGKSERTVHRRLENAVLLVRSKLCQS